MFAIFRALRHPRFALLLAGQTPSRLGDFLYQVALAWWVLEKTGSATKMGTVLVFSFAPMVLFVLIGGVAVDRFPRARLIFISDLGRGLVMAIMTALVWTDRLEIWMVYVGSLFFGLADAFFQPALVALIPQVVPEDDLPSANSLSSLSMQFGRVAGPALGGLLLAAGGTSLAFGLNALSFFLSALSLIPLLSLPLPSAAEPVEERHPLADFREGLRLVFASPFLWVTILVAAFVNVTLSGPFQVGMPFLVRDHLGGDEKMLGLIYAIFPIGYALASLALGHFPRLRRRGLLMYVCLGLAGIGLGVFGLNLPLAVLIVAALINGAALEVDALIWTNVMQEYVPQEKLGRVASIDMLGSFVLLPIGYALTGWLIDFVGAAGIFVAAGTVTLLVSLLPLLNPAIRKLD